MVKFLTSDKQMSDAGGQMQLVHAKNPDKTCMKFGQKMEHSGKRYRQCDNVPSMGDE